MQPYHWSMRYFDFLKQYDQIPAVNFLNRPLDRIELSQHIYQMTNLNDPTLKSMADLLEEEFKPEFEIFNENFKNFPPFLARLNGSFNLNKTHDTPATDFQLNPQIFFPFSKNLSFFVNLKLFKEAPATYIGKTFRGLHAYMEQSYLFYQTNHVQLKLGRDFIQFGPGRTGQLLFSDNSRTFDQYFVKLFNKYLSFSFFGITLDKRHSESLPQNPNKIANRYINGHRLSFNLQNKYFIGMSEVVLYGGPNRNWELAFINPVNFYYASTSNGPHMDANFLYNIDWDFYFPYNINLYGELLIDDYQVDKKEPGDLEPNEIGLLGGINYTPQFIPYSRLNIEYVQIRNRTYNAPILDWEKYLHRNEVIGYYLGNDFKLWYAMFEKWWTARLQSKLHITFLRKGEGTVRGAFNTDYMNYSVEEGYNEPFPWGIVESNLQIGLEGFYYLNKWLNMDFIIYRDSYKNFQHIRGKSKNQISMRLNLFFQLSKLIL